MLNKQLILILLCLVPFTVISEEINENWKLKVNQTLRGSLNQFHYVDQKINDNYSRRIFNLYLNRIDPNKHFLTELQITELSAFEYKIDNDIRNNTFNFIELCILRLKEQIEFVDSIYNTILKQPINISAENYFEIDFEKKKYAKNNSELTKLWKSTIQYQTAQNYVTLFKEKYPSENNLIIEKELELEARLKTKKDLNRRFKRLKEKTTKDYYIDYFDTMTRSFGPHTTYLPPEEKEDFDINMSGQLEGIGAVLREEDGFIKVVRIIPGSASWRQGKLKAEDIILKVAQTNTEAVSIIETPVREAVKLIRGRKGTEVILTVKKPDGIIENISIVRDIVVLKSTYARSGIFYLNNNPYGYINLPSFYRDFDNKNNRNASDDLKDLLEILTENNVNGLILDLRNNGGGSLRDAVNISGFFIDKGPVVQVSDNNKRKETYRDIDNKLYYDKPLIVLVNTFSASASEIVAAALQDYNRALIIGDKHTFGKGTVQKVLDLNRNYSTRSFMNKKDLGYLKITIQEYFRITGESTQFNGVTPDIVFPNQYDYLEVGEKELKYAFKGTITQPINYKKWPYSLEKDKLVSRTNKRLEGNRTVKTLNDYNTFMKNQREESYKSVTVSDLWGRLQTIKEKNKIISELEIEKTYSEFKPLEPNYDEITDESSKKDLDNWIKKFETDFTLNEALLVLENMELNNYN